MLTTLLGIGLLSGGAACLAALAVDHYSPTRLSVVFGEPPEGELDDDEADLDDEDEPVDADEGLW